jgi:peptide/nickel transport system substrate-binding protein
VRVPLGWKSLGSQGVDKGENSAIDVPALIALQGESLNARAYALIKPPQLGYWPDAPHYNRDVDRARHLLKKAGVSALRVDLATSGNKAVGELIQSNLQEIGIATNILLNPPSDYDTNVKKAQLTYVNYGGGPDPYFTIEWFTTSQIGIWNWAFWSNKEFDRLLVALAREFNPHKRAEMAIRMQQLMDESAGFIWVNRTVLHSAGQPHVKPAFTWDGVPDYRDFTGT